MLQNKASMWVTCRDFACDVDPDRLVGDATEHLLDAFVAWTRILGPALWVARLAGTEAGANGRLAVADLVITVIAATEVSSVLEVEAAAVAAAARSAAMAAKVWPVSAWTASPPGSRCQRRIVRST